MNIPIFYTRADNPLAPPCLFRARSPFQRLLWAVLAALGCRSWIPYQKTCWSSALTLGAQTCTRRRLRRILRRSQASRRRRRLDRASEVRRHRLAECETYVALSEPWSRTSLQPEDGIRRRILCPQVVR